MPSFSPHSMARLNTCHPDLADLFLRVVEDFDCAIIDGHRGKDRQNEYYESGASQLQWPRSKHNKIPSLAVDVAPYPVNYDDIERFVLFAGFVLGTAEELGIRCRWGGDWDSDSFTADERFRDLTHFELVVE